MTLVKVGPGTWIDPERVLYLRDEQDLGTTKIAFTDTGERWVRVDATVEEVAERIAAASVPSSPDAV